MKVRINPYCVLLSFVILGMTRFSYLFPSSIGFSFISFENIVSYFIIGWAIIVIVSEHSSISKFKYWWIPFAGIVLILLSSLQGHFLYSGQGLFDGVIGQIYGIAGLLLYFPISSLLHAKKITIHDLENVFIFCSVFQMIVYYAQFIVGPNHVFLSCYYLTESARESVYRIRLYGNVQPITIALFFCLNSILHSKNKMRSLIVIVMTIIFAIVINQGRAYIISIVILVIVAPLLKPQKKNKLFFILLLMAAIVYWLVNTDFFQNALAVFQTSNIDTRSDTVGVRLRAQSYFMETVRNHWLLGGGYPNVSVSSAYIAIGYELGYRLVDVGVYAFIYKYGLIGCLWALYILILLIKNGLHLRKTKNDVILLLEVILLLVGFFTSVSWFDGFGFYTLMIWIIYAEVLKGEGNVRKIKRVAG